MQLKGVKDGKNKKEDQRRIGRVLKRQNNREEQRKREKQGEIYSGTERVVTKKIKKVEGDT